MASEALNGRLWIAESRQQGRFVLGPGECREPCLGHLESLRQQLDRGRLTSHEVRQRAKQLGFTKRGVCAAARGMATGLSRTLMRQGASGLLANWSAPPMRWTRSAPTQ